VKSMNVRLLAIVSLVALAVVMRFLPLPVNFSPIGALALFAGMTITNRVGAFAVPMLAMFASDLVLGLHDLMWVVYGTFAVIVLVGIYLRDQKGVMPKVAGALFASVLFFVVTNFAVWATSGMYPMTYEGMVDCYIAAIPFFKNQVAGDLAFTAALFTGWAYLVKAVPALEPVRA
jgi:hypothetical protein